MSAIRDLASDLAARSDARLRDLLTARPDLILPPVPDFAALAARASTRISVQRALENLTEPELDVLTAVQLTAHSDTGQSTTAGWLRTEIAGATVKVLDGILAHLHSLALVRRAPPPGDAPDADRNRRFYLPVQSLGEALGPYPAGLGRELPQLARLLPSYAQRLPAAVELLRGLGLDVPVAGTAATTDDAAAVVQRAVSSPASWETLLAKAPERTGDLLGRLSVSAVGTSPAAAGDDSSPIQWLIRHGLLARLDANHVELPREVGRASRGHVIIGRLRAAPPTPDLGAIRTSLRDNAAHGAVAETLRLITELVAVVGEHPIATLRSGGVGVREIRRLAEALRVDTDQASWLVELGAIAGLLALDVDTSRWRVEPGMPWLTQDRVEQWRRLVTAWQDAQRAPALVGSQLTAGTTINALAAEAARPDAPHIRSRMLAALTALSTAAEGGPGDDGRAPVLTENAVVERLTWSQPRLQRRFVRLVPGMMAEATRLGLLGSGALTELGALTAEGKLDDAAAVLRSALPAPLRHFMLQADLTAVAPGYLEPEVAAELALLSTPEGQGPASIYRFSADSLRRAFDAGQDAPSILAFLGRHSATDVPQPLKYLVDDTASRYGRLRVGRANSYVRSDDDAALSALLTDPRAAALGLVQLAPTVVVSQASGPELAAVLRDLGYAPALEGAPLQPTAGRSASAGGAGSPSSSRVTVNPWTLSAEDITHQVEVLRGAGTSPANGMTTAESDTLLGLETLRKAIRLRSPVRLGFADSQGNSTRQVLVPLSVSGGRVRVIDPANEVEKVVSIHRIMDVELLTLDEGAATDA
ncbi:helicase-associated domain-containing protein [Arthrobacter sp. 260]|uniref:helicase-associated domain-containing protein n=1 Tax=Arthrobacter sp. 260 TaxID=2735314 RepID=UPI001491C7AB|nr:helicase-associated domain-containing protein [Arthrobacter sp. 260]NOJ61056.1 helicase-associated domain-containing protein [Arthrobacter sp. 260]